MYEDIKRDNCFSIKSIHVDDSFCVSSALTVSRIKLVVLRKQKANFTRR